MSNDRYERIRVALEMGPTPGSWYLSGEGIRALVRNANGVIVAAGHRMPGHKNETIMRMIAACDPDTIRALLAERDALAAEVERLAEALREAYGQVKELCDAHAHPYPEASFDRYEALLRDQEEGK